MERFTSKTLVDPATGCWEWQGFIQPHGYGTFWWNGRSRAAHRASWEIYHGSIPEGMLVLHRCDNPPCVNPDHLFLGTNKDNSEDMVAKGRSTHGSKQWCSKLDEETVASLRSRFLAGESAASLARELGLHRSTVARAVTARRWRRVDAPAAPQEKRQTLSDEDVEAIRTSTESQRVLAERYSVNQSQISRIKNGKRRNSNGSHQ